METETQYDKEFLTDTALMLMAQAWSIRLTEEHVMPVWVIFGREGMSFVGLPGWNPEDREENERQINELAAHATKIEARAAFYVADTFMRILPPGTDLEHTERPGVALDSVEALVVGGRSYTGACVELTRIYGRADDGSYFVKRDVEVPVGNVRGDEDKFGAVWATLTA